MTIIIAYKDKDRTWLASDSMVCGDCDYEIRRDSKIFSPNDNLLIGFSGLVRVEQLIAHSGIFDKCQSLSVDAMIRDYIPLVKELLKDGDYGIWQHIYCDKENVFLIDDSLQVCETDEPYTVAGSGRPWALGSLFTTLNMDIPVIEKIRLALLAAEYSSLFVRGPYYLYNTEKASNKIILGEIK